MLFDPRQLLLLGIAIAVPTIAFLTNRPRITLAWVGFTLFVQVFDTSTVTNLPAGRLVGLMYLPVALGMFRHWIKIPPARAWLINFLYMVVLGYVFGFLFPWPDISNARPITLRAEGRSVIFLVRTMADVSLTVFVMNQVVKPGAFDTLRNWMVRGAVVNAFAGFFAFLTGLDPYGLLTGLRLYATASGRARGLSFEPRGLGLACAYGMILILAKQTRRPRDWVALLILAGALASSFSASAMAALAAGVMVILFLGSMRVRAALMVSAAVILVLGVLLIGVFPYMAEYAQFFIGQRLAGRGILDANVPANAAEAIALRMDVFDSAASLFLIRNPIYAVIGTGPGLVSLPASEHIPYGLYRAIWTVIDNPPSHGILLELTNTGILGVWSWTFQVLSILFLGKRLFRRRGLPFPPKAIRTTFVAAAALYAVQASPSPFWAVFLGVGWAIAEVALPFSVGVKARRHRRHDVVNPVPVLSREPAQ